jgi:hypothetical protein
MAFKFVAILATLAMASAGYVEQPQVVQYQGGLGSYSDGHLAVGHSSQDILRTHGGTVSQISKQVVSPHSSVSKSVTSVNNEGYKTLAYAAPAVQYHQQPAVQYQSYAAPAVYQQTYAAPAVAKTVQYSAPAVVAKQVSYSAGPAQIAYHQQPAVQYQSYAAPAYAKSVQYSAPVYAKSVEYSAPAVYQQSYAAPAVHSYAAPAVHSYAAPTYAKSVQYSAPAVYQSYAAPAVKTVQYAAPTVSKAVVAAPAVSAYSTKAVSFSPAEQVAHFTFDSPAAHYAW